MGGRLKLRIFPREESYFDLFDEVSANLADAARQLLDMVEDFVDPEMKAKRLVEAEHEGDRLTHAIYSRLNSTFITPFDREDIHALAGQLDDVLDAIEAAADMLVLHRVTEPLEAGVEQARLIDPAPRARGGPGWSRPGCSPGRPGRPPTGCAACAGSSRSRCAATSSPSTSWRT